MLTYESLIEQAKARSMPAGKIRGVLREYLQVLILKELYRTDAGKKLYFTGGTYLRLIHGLKRFSEDLDFNTTRLGKKEFEALMETVKRELWRADVKARLDFAHWRDIYVSKLTFQDVEKDYNVISKHSKKKGIIIKIETNKPKHDISTETKMISGFGEIYPCICTKQGVLFADKIDALGKKNRARHIYDIIFMLGNKYPIDKKRLRHVGIKKDGLEAILDGIKRFSGEELKRQADSLRPFLFDESEADLVANARTVIPLMVEKYKQ